MAHRSIESIGTKEALSKGTLLGAISIAAISAAYMADSQAGANDGRGRSEKADVVSNIRAGEDAVFTVPGYHANGRVIGKNLDRHFQHLGTTHYAVHPEKGFDLDSIRESWLEARKKDGHRPARIYAMSMGALLVSRLFSDEQFRSEFGEVKSLVLDSALSGPGDINASSKLAMGLGAILPITYTTGKIYNMVTSREVHHKIVDHAPEVLRSEAEEHIMSSTKTSFDAAKAQIMFMRHNDVRHMDLQPLGLQLDNNVVFIASPRDNLLNVDQSSHRYSDALGQDIEFWTDTRRADGTHATGPEWPQGPIDAMQNQNHDNYRIRSIRHQTGRAASGLWIPQSGRLRPAI